MNSGKQVIFISTWRTNYKTMRVNFGIYRINVALSWKEKWAKLPPIIATLNDTVVGFTEFEPNGHIDCFYVHHEFQNQGVGSALITAIEMKAKSHRIYRVYAEVSITAKIFFENKGFNTVKKQLVTIRGCKLTNFVMEKILFHNPISIRIFTAADIPIIVDAFIKSKWVEKPAYIFEQYLMEQHKKERVVWVAYIDKTFAGYITLVWKSRYKKFKNNTIPEIVDLNVLPDFRRLGIGSMLIQQAEEEGVVQSDVVGIGVGLYSDYGSAQRLYVKRGFIPDAEGVTYKYRSTTPGSNYRLDDDLILWFTKKLNHSEVKC